MYYAEQRFLSELANIQRQAMLPEVAIGNVQVEKGAMVDVRDTVARGLIPAAHIIVNASAELGIKPEDVNDWLLVAIGAQVEAGQAIAGRELTRGKRAYSPVSGIVISVDEGNIILQQSPTIIRLDAGVRGRVTEVFPGRGVNIEARGAILQGVWGNDRNVIAVLRWEPERGGIEGINIEELDTTYKNEIVMRRKPLTLDALEIGVVRGFAGLIVPSMSADLIEPVLDYKIAVMLTEGFGNMNMSAGNAQLLGQFNGVQGTLDAASPQRFSERRPELVINRPVSGEVDDLTKVPPISIGARVRVTRSPFIGSIGIVEELPSTPILLENGLRVKCAVVELLSGQFVDVPLANLELAGT